MLYHDPATTRPTGFLRRLQFTLAAFGRRRRQKLADLDLASASRHLRQDLGLDDIGLFRR